MKKRTEKEIEKVIVGIKKERKRLPEFSIFEDNNWETFDEEIKTLEECLKLDETDIEGKLNELLDACDSLGIDPCENYAIKVYDWVLDKTDEFDFYLEKRKKK